MKRLRPLFKKLALSFSILMVVLILFLLEENLRGQIALRSYLRQLRHQGEKLTLAELDLPTRPTDGHVAAELLALTNQFDALRKDCPFIIEFAARLRLAAPGRALVRARQPDLGVARKSSAPLSERASWHDLHEQATRAADMLRRLKNVLAQPAPGFPIDYTQGMEARLPHLQLTLDGVNWLALAALYDLHRRDWTAATENIVTIAALTRFAKHDRFTCSQFCRTQVGGTGLWMTWEALQTSGWTEGHLISLQQAWQNSRVIEDTVSALEVERVLYRDYFERARHLSGWNELRISLLYHAQCGCASYSLSAFLFDVQQSIRTMAWRLAWLDQDELRFLQRWQLAVDRIRDAVACRAWLAAHLSANDFSNAPTRYDRWRFLLSDAFKPNVEHTLLPLFEFETLREMTVAAVAIARYQLRTGNLPSDLAALVPAYLPQLPHDWMNGEPLRYQPHPDGTFTLYSVGADGRDDGGDPRPADRPRALSIWAGRDAVWPQPASAEEIAAAQRR